MLNNEEEVGSSIALPGMDLGDADSWFSSFLSNEANKGEEAQKEDPWLPNLAMLEKIIAEKYLDIVPVLCLGDEPMHPGLLQMKKQNFKPNMSP